VALRERANKVAERAQEDKPFSHHFRHVAYDSLASRFPRGSDVKSVKQWFGHESEAGIDSNWSRSTKKFAENVGH
jgi:hypothetical protein